jgi:tetratricopeptide (TPR) repeat protein
MVTLFQYLKAFEIAGDWTICSTQYNRMHLLLKCLKAFEISSISLIINCLQELKDLNCNHLNKLEYLLHILRAELYNNYEEFENALVSCNVVLEWDPDCDIAIYHSGIALQNLKRYNESIVQFCKLGGSTFGRQSVLRLGDCYNELGQYNNAVQCYILYYNDSQDSSVLPKLATMQYRLGYFADVIYNCKKILKRDRTNISFILMLIDSLIQMYNNSSHFERYMEQMMEDSYPYLTDRHRFLVHKKRAEYFLLRKPDLALDEFTEALDYEPNNVELLITRGRIYYQMGDYESAVNDFSNALDNDNSANVFNDRGACYFKLEMYEAAIHEFSTSLIYDDQNIMAYLNRSDVYMKMNNYTDAIADCEKVVEIQSKAINQSELGSIDYLRLLENIAIASYQLERYQDAIVALTKLLEQDSNNSGTYEMLTLCFEKIANENMIANMNNQ